MATGKLMDRSWSDKHLRDLLLTLWTLSLVLFVPAGNHPEGQPLTAHALGTAG